VTGQVNARRIFFRTQASAEESLKLFIYYNQQKELFNTPNGVIK